MHVPIINALPASPAPPACAQGRPIEVLKLQKSGGVVTRERDERRLARDMCLRQYFYGCVS